MSLTFTILAIVLSFTEMTVRAAERSSAGVPGRGPIAAVELADPLAQSKDSSSAPTKCPYQFGSDMPSSTFCVYRGVTLGSGGEVCATNVEAVWSSFGSPLAMRKGSAEASGWNREVYIGFIADPDLVLRAVVDPRRSNHAEMVAYTVGREEVAQPLAGVTTLRTVRWGARGTADVLSMELQSPPVGSGSCAFVSYWGTFVGVIRPPMEIGAEPMSSEAVPPAGS